MEVGGCWGGLGRAGTGAVWGVWVGGWACSGWGWGFGGVGAGFSELEDVLVGDGDEGCGGPGVGDADGGSAGVVDEPGGGVP